MNYLVAGRACVGLEALCTALEARGDRVRQWSPDDAVPPESSTAFDCVVWTPDFDVPRLPSVSRRLYWGVESPARNYHPTHRVPREVDPRYVSAVIETLGLPVPSGRNPHPVTLPIPDLPCPTVSTGAGVLSGLPPVAYVGRVNCLTGYGAAARHQIWALRRHGLRMRVLDAGSTGDPDPRRENVWVQSCRGDTEGVDATCGTIVHLSPNCAGEWLDRLPGPRVLVSVWETSRLPQEWVAHVNAFNQAWCATAWQAEVYRDSGVDEHRVRVVPFALDPGLYPAEGPCLPELRDLRVAGTYVLGAVFQWTARKAPEVLVGAFLQAFQAGEDVALVLKTYEGDEPAAAIRARVDAIVASYRLTGPAPRVEVISRRLTHDETLAFHRGLDCYVSTHRGEGFGLPIAEALLLGRPVVATDWSAPAEYAQGLYAPVAYHLEAPCAMDWQPFYFIDQRWATPHMDSVAQWMRAAYDRRLVAPYPAAVQARFQGLMDAVGPAAHAALREVL